MSNRCFSIIVTWNFQIHHQSSWNWSSTIVKTWNLGKIHVETTWNSKKSRKNLKIKVANSKNHNAIAKNGGLHHCQVTIRLQHGEIFSNLHEKPKYWCIIVKSHHKQKKSQKISKFKLETQISNIKHKVRAKFNAGNTKFTFHHCQRQNSRKMQW